MTETTTLTPSQQVATLLGTMHPVKAVYVLAQRVIQLEERITEIEKKAETAQKMAKMRAARGKKKEAQK